MPVLDPGSRSPARLPVLNSIQDLDDVREGAFGLKGSFRLPAPSPRYVILNLIQDPFPRLFTRADAQVGSFCGGRAVDSAEPAERRGDGSAALTMTGFFVGARSP